MGQKNKILLLILIFVFSCCSNSFTLLATHSKSRSYWIWAGIRIEDVKEISSKDVLYIHQGHFKCFKGDCGFRKLGLFPHPRKNPVFLVYRISGGLPSAAILFDVFQRQARDWEKHNVTIKGVQLDFDSPTSKLLQYGHVLESIRGYLPERYELSITGLADWVLSGDPETLKRISSTVDELVFQLYQNRSHFTNLDRYLEFLKKIEINYKVGLLYHESPEEIETRLKSFPKCQGSILFFQRHPALPS